MCEKAIGFVNQLIEKTEQGKLSWSTGGFEDGQFKTLLPGGKLAFVVSVNGDVGRFRMLDDHQEVILDETVTRDEAHLASLRGESQPDILYGLILNLQELARNRALRVNEKLAEAERLLLSI